MCRWLFDLYGTCKLMKSLPYQGGVNQQPAFMIDAFEIIEGAVARHDQIKARKDEHDRKIEEARAKRNGKSKRRLHR